MSEKVNQPDNLLLATCFHEAGHFVCLASLGVEEATLQLRKTCDECRPGFSAAIESDHQIDTINKAMVAFGGPIAESLFISESLPNADFIKDKVQEVIRNNTHFSQRLESEIRFGNCQSVTSGNWCGDCPYIQAIKLDDFTAVFNAAWDIVIKEWSSIQAIVTAIEERYNQVKDLKEARKTSYPLKLPGTISTRLYMDVWTRGNHEFRVLPSLTNSLL